MAIRLDVACGDGASPPTAREAASIELKYQTSRKRQQRLRMMKMRSNGGGAAGVRLKRG